MHTTIEAIKIAAATGSVTLAVGVIKLNTTRRPHSRDRTTTPVTVTRELGVYTREGSPLHLEALKFSEMFTFKRVTVEADSAFAEDLEYGFAALPAQPSPKGESSLPEAITPAPEAAPAEVVPVVEAPPAEPDQIEKVEPVAHEPKPKHLKFGHAKRK